MGFGDILAVGLAAIAIGIGVFLLYLFLSAWIVKVTANALGAKITVKEALGVNFIIYFLLLVFQLAIGFLLIPLGLILGELLNYYGIQPTIQLVAQLSSLVLTAYLYGRLIKDSYGFHTLGFLKGLLIFIVHTLFFIAVVFAYMYFTIGIAISVDSLL